MPQRKSFIRQFFDNGGIWAVLFLGACIFATVLGFRDSLSDRRLAKDGVEAQATVMSLYETISHTGRGTNHRYHVGVSFVAGQETVLAEQTVSQNFYGSMRTGMVIPIRYWTGDPTLIEVQPGSFAEHARQLYFMAIVAALLTLPFGVPAGLWALSTRWMVRNGVQHRVEVAAHVECPIPIQARKWQLVWRESSGVRTTSRFRYLADLPPVGAQIIILTDPSGQRPSIWKRDL